MRDQIVQFKISELVCGTRDVVEIFEDYFNKADIFAHAESLLSASHALIHSPDR